MADQRRLLTRFAASRRDDLAPRRPAPGRLELLRQLLGDAEQPLAALHLGPDVVRIDAGRHPQHHQIVEEIGALADRPPRCGRSWRRSRLRPLPRRASWPSCRGPHAAAWPCARPPDRRSERQGRPDRGGRAESLMSNTITPSGESVRERRLRSMCGRRAVALRSRKAWPNSPAQATTTCTNAWAISARDSAQRAHCRALASPICDQCDPTVPL